MEWCESGVNTERKCVYLHAALSPAFVTIGTSIILPVALLRDPFHVQFLRPKLCSRSYLIVFRALLSAALSPQSTKTPPMPRQDHSTQLSAQALEGEQVWSTNSEVRMLMTALPRSIPSLLSYVDHDLVQSTASYNHPPHANATCPVCFNQWDTPTLAGGLQSAASAFLPLSPCGHWVHYRCLIRLATKIDDDRKDKCVTCGVQLFVWEGITALTLATRTGLEIDGPPVTETGKSSFPNIMPNTLQIRSPLAQNGNISIEDIQAYLNNT